MKKPNAPLSPLRNSPYLNLHSNNMRGFLGLLHVNLFRSFSLITLFSTISISADTLTSTQSLGINQTLVSSNETFELGFFNSTTSSSRWYLGIWYKNIPDRTIVWVANRDTPLENTTATLKIGDRGNLVLLDPVGNSIWSSNQSEATTSNPVLQLLDSGNLVLREANENDTTKFLWQSFDFPTDTLLPGMKLGWNLDTGIERYITSWKSEDDPSSGDYSFRLEYRGIPEAFLYDKEVKTFRTGPWNGIRFGGLAVVTSQAVVQDTLVENAHEVYYTPSSVLNGNQSILTRFVMNWTGEVQRFAKTQKSQSWNKLWYAPKDECDNFECGPYAICDANAFPVCKCFQGFNPKNQQEWDLRNFSSGCARSTELDCGKDKFLQQQHVELPDTTTVFVNRTMSLSECEDVCRKNCSCSAYANVAVTNGGIGCAMWTDEPKDMRQFSDGGQDVYIKVAASVVADSGPAGGSRKKKNVGMIVGITVGAVIIGSMMLIIFLFWKKRKSRNIPRRRPEQRGAFGISQEVLLFSSNTEHSGDRNVDDLELPLFDFNTITMATDNFSMANKLGQGGFGSVYRGRLFEGQEIAVKRLSKDSGQGIEEFKNEVRLIAKLQHRNLVRMFGCCIEKDEKMLVYEYMENTSLDVFLFDKEKSSLLDWQLRINIICGIARGLLYLHQDSRLRIIHRDLKASNILLDKEMNPKISDFGMARIFGNNQTEANTLRVVGTYGYMSPEYALDGLFSVKSDVFSFGVLVLEIISGKKNKGFYYTDELNLLGHSWKLWNEGRPLELVDSSFGNSYSTSEALRCIQVGLICVQERPEDRPTMSSVVLMLSSETASIPQPRNPGFILARTPIDIDSSSIPQEESYSVNQVTVTVVDAR